ncbi:uncharacterized protein LOC143736855 isoform X2 [Siphateles boraxobius]|uniref:uncharacterized protein LOC143736855 isoform X2 n=1 Tax=Siphateles boraxobius TaxID=180520 RepID=UPI0040627C42
MEKHDKQPQKYHQLYRTHWGNTLYCRTKREDLASCGPKSEDGQKVYASTAGHQAQYNRLMYVLVKLLWLCSPKASRSNPEKASILKAYDSIQHRVLVDDQILCKAGIPLPKINTKTVRDFIRQQERLVNLHDTRQSAVISKTTSVSSEELPSSLHHAQHKGVEGMDQHTGGDATGSAGEENSNHHHQGCAALRLPVWK